MIKQKFKLVTLLFFLLAGCNTIEHRSEKIVKEPLPNLSVVEIKETRLWSNRETSGMGKKGVGIRLALTPSSLYVTDYQGKLLALDRFSGERKWRIDAKEAITAGPAVAATSVFLGTENGQILAYQTEDGQLLWKASVESPVIATPIGNDEAVFVHALNDSVMALSADKGRELWRYQATTPPITLRRGSSPVLGKSEVIVGFSNGKLVSLNRLTGMPTWEKEIAQSKGRSDIQRMVDVSADPVVDGNQVYAVSYQGKMVALALETGSAVWEKDLSSFSGVAVGKNVVVVADSNGSVWGLKRSSGETLWEQTALKGRFLSQPAIFKEYVFVGDDDGYLHALRQSDGAFVGRVLVDSKGIEAAPIVKEDVLYVLGRGGVVAAYRLSIMDHSKGN